MKLKPSFLTVALALILLINLNVDLTSGNGTPGTDIFSVCIEDANFDLLATQDLGKSISVYYYPHLKPLAETILFEAQQSMFELIAYFGFTLSHESRIYLATDREHLNALVGRETKPWVVGTALDANDIVILNPDHWNPRSHEFVRLSELVKHELAHAFTQQLNSQITQLSCQEHKKNNSDPYWFSEGLATVVSGQMETWRNRVMYDFEAHPAFEQIFQYTGYATAGTAVKYLLDQFGRERLLMAIRSMPPGYYEKQADSDLVLFDVLGKSKESLQAQWREYALTFYPPQKRDK